LIDNPQRPKQEWMGLGENRKKWKERRKKKKKASRGGLLEKSFTYQCPGSKSQKRLKREREEASRKKDQKEKGHRKRARRNWVWTRQTITCEAHITFIQRLKRVANREILHKGLLKGGKTTLKSSGGKKGGGEIYGGIIYSLDVCSFRRRRYLGSVAKILKKKTSKEARLQEDLKEGGLRRIIHFSLRWKAPGNHSKKKNSETESLQG